VGDPLSGVESSINGFTKTIQTGVIAVPFIIGGAALVVLGLLRMTGADRKIGQAARTAAEGAALA
jgi:hypothetical protein